MGHGYNCAATVSIYTHLTQLEQSCCYGNAPNSAAVYTGMYPSHEGWATDGFRSFFLFEFLPLKNKT